MPFQHRPGGARRIALSWRGTTCAKSMKGPHVLVAAAVVIAACGNSDDDAGSQTGARIDADCESRSEAVTSDTEFAFDDTPPDAPLPECIPTCGAHKSAEGFYRADALPAGSCTAADAACEMGAHQLCPCTTDRGPVNGYRCSCVEGRWTCVVWSQGASVCSGGNCGG